MSETSVSATSGLIEPVVLGTWFDDFEVGARRLSPGRTITEADLVNFSGLTGDFSQVHTDEEFCKKTEFGTRVAHGLLGLSIAQGLSWRTGYTQGTGVASLAWNNWNFRKPIRIGDTVRVRWHVTEKRESRSKPGMGIIVEWVELVNQHGDIVQSGEHVSMIRKRPHA